MALSTPFDAPAQVDSGMAGALAGTAGGGYVALAIVTAQALAGTYLYRPDQADWQLTPIPIAAAAGAAIGASGWDRLGESSMYGGIGFAAGTALGALVGHAAGNDSEDTWSGAIIGGAAGLLVGVALGAATWEPDAPSGPAGEPLRAVTPLLTLRLPVVP